MTGVMTLYRTSIGKKVVMAVTGLILLGFVVVHMIGNLKVFAGAAALNEYAYHLRLLGEPIFGYEQFLWIARVVLLGAVVMHIVSAAQLTIQNRNSRSTSYDQSKGIQPAYRYASYTMRWGGIVILLFIIFHLLHFTFGFVGYGSGGFLHPEGAGYNTTFYVYDNFINGFRVPIVSIFYMIAMVALALHIYHGTWSMFQTLGLNGSRTDGMWRGLAAVLALAVGIGNISMPLAVLTGIIG
ncbi:MAG: succinate dehydrogenase cytochrome b subunit [Chloroflexaceae bacterium]|nr:succinate dehydrogenase cytochrome b subunit [Chloroflexaceae bacterium]NJL35039.1 succinate dehydrogenase cytochrome b subunit [Chloroflexaceae bacterium]NJO05072.1 succinate dehydrogenase cytochrome b subunit [Chloroflexaceae bacterium]